jgi:hypothetical protein
LTVPTPTERINQLTDLFNALSSKVDRLAETTSTDAKKFRDEVRDIRDVVEKLRESVVSGLVTDGRHDERLKAIETATEKGSDRRWQLAPILLSATAVALSIIFGVVNTVIALKK